jgi:integrase
MKSRTIHQKMAWLGVLCYSAPLTIYNKSGDKMTLGKRRSPYYLYKKATKSGDIWYAAFWDNEARRYAITRSTGIIAGGKKQRKAEAEKAAQALLPGIFKKAPDILFTRYVSDFWRPESPYVKERATVKQKPLSAYYIKMNHQAVERHMETYPPFHDLTLGNLSPRHIRDWLSWMAQKGLAGRSINSVLQAMRVAVRYAVAMEELEKDPFHHIEEAAENIKEKGVLNYSEVSRLLNSPIHDPRTRLAVLLGLLCGMRRGEVRGLQWGDIDNELVFIHHNYINEDGLKSPKCGSTRQVPLPSHVLEVLELLRQKRKNLNPDGYVLDSDYYPGKPLGNHFIHLSLEQELRFIGIAPDEQKRRNLTFHGLRHSFVTLGRMAGISDFEIQALAGHKSGSMMEHYSHASQVIDFATTKEKLEKAISSAAV